MQCGAQATAAKLGHKILWYLVLLVSNALLETSAFKGFPLKLFQNGLFFVVVVVSILNGLKLQRKLYVTPI